MQFIARPPRLRPAVSSNGATSPFVASRFREIAVRVRVPIAALLVLASVGAKPAPAQQREEVEEESLTSEAPETAERLDLSSVESQITDSTNEFRAQHGREPVARSAALAAAARDFAAHMARTDRYGHHADGRRPAERASAAGYDYCIVSENIAYQFRSSGFESSELARAFFEGWRDSPEHRENMLDPGVTETGLGVAHSRRTGNYYAVQMFGRPKSERIAFRIANRAGVTVEYRLGRRTYQLPPRSTRRHTLCRRVALEFPDIAPDAEAAAGDATPNNSTRSTTTQAAVLTLHPSDGEV